MTQDPHNIPKNRIGRQEQAMARFVQRAAQSKATLLAGPLRRYAEAEGMSWEELAASIECTPATLDTVAMCRPPRPATFVADATTIANGQVDVDLLITLLRRLQVLEAFNAADHASLAHDREQVQILLAAMDRESRDTTGQNTPVEEQGDPKPSEG